MPSSFSHQFVNTRKGNLNFFFLSTGQWSGTTRIIECESSLKAALIRNVYVKKSKAKESGRKMGDEGTGRVQHSKRELKRRHWNKDEQSVHPISDDSKIKDKWKGTHEIWKKKKSHMQLASASVCVSMLSYVLLDRVHSPWIFGHAGQLVCA